MKHVTKKERKRILRFVVGFADSLGLPRHEWLLSEESAGDEANASISWGRQRWHATLAMGDNWRNLDDLDLRNTLVHEVLHLVQRRTDDVASRARRAMHKHEYDPWHSDYFQEVELMCDQMAMYLADSTDVITLWDATA